MSTRPLKLNETEGALGLSAAAANEWSEGSVGREHDTGRLLSFPIMHN